MQLTTSFLKKLLFLLSLSAIINRTAANDDATCGPDEEALEVIRTFEEAYCTMLFLQVAQCAKPNLFSLPLCAKIEIEKVAECNMKYVQGMSPDQVVEKMAGYRKTQRDLNEKKACDALIENQDRCNGPWSFFWSMVVPCESVTSAAVEACDMKFSPVRS